MKLTLQLKLVPSPEQHTALLATIRAFNAAASHAARVGFNARVFGQASIRWVNHGIAKRLVQLAKDTKAVLVLEDLTHIRRRMTVGKRQRAKQHNWSFGQLRDFLTYKAQRAGVPVVFVDPRNTSKTCSHCGYMASRNRYSQAEFSCIRCGFECHADFNAARNLTVRGEVTRPDLIAPRLGQLALAW